MWNLGPIVMASLFAGLVTPAAREIFALRRESAQRAAQEAVAEAILEERNRQLLRLDAVARPGLERIAAGGPFSADEIGDFEALEAHLRDLIRAPGLIDPEMDAAVWHARRRGVSVRLYDDHGLDEVSPAIRDGIRRRVIGELAAINGGTVTVRILPAGRSRLVTLVLDDAEHPRRVEFLADGSCRADPP